MHKSPDIFLFKAFIAAVAHYKICTTIFAITSRFSQNFYCHNFIFAAAALVFVTIKIRGLLKFPRQCALCPDQCGCKILMRAYGFGKAFWNSMYSLWEMPKSWLRSAHCCKNGFNAHIFQHVLQIGLRATLQALTAAVATLQQTVQNQGRTIAMQQSTLDDKCDVIEQQQLDLQRINETLQATADDVQGQVAMLNRTIADKCEIIEQQQMNLQQVNGSLQMFIAEQETSNSEQDDIAANLTALASRFPRTWVSTATTCTSTKHPNSLSLTPISRREIGRVQIASFRYTEIPFFFSKRGSTSEKEFSA